MGVEVRFSPNPIEQRDARIARQFEHVVLEALRGWEALAEPGPIQVQFHVWDGDDVPRYVCKVECSGSIGIERSEPPWRWWSGLLESPQDLGQALREAIRARLARRRDRSDAQRPAPQDRWGWAEEMQLR
jgi:hypothetical protein